MITAKRLARLILPALVLTTAAPLAARTTVDRGLNLFSDQQDVEMGREAAAEAEKQLPLLRDPELERYVQEVGERLARVSIEPGFPYRFRVVDSAEINAFALPGGFVYVNRGILEAAADESELAGVIGHEVGHVAARHGTSQLSKQVLVQMPLALFMGSVLKGEGGWKQSLAKLGVNLGMSAVFLSYSRKAEEQADILATQQLHDAGYDPTGVARFFQKMEERARREPSRLEKFFSSHPAAGDRRAAALAEAQRLGPPRGDPSGDGRAFARIKARLGGLPPPYEQGHDREPDLGGGRPRVPAPSARWVRVEDPAGRFRTRMPRGWEARAGEQGSVVLAPPEARQQVRGAITHGVVIRFADRLLAGRRGGQDDLEAALDRVVAQLTAANPHLRERARARRRVSVGDGEGVSSVLSGRIGSARQRDRGYEEVVSVTLLPDSARSRRDAVVVLAFAPAEDRRAFEPAFAEVLRSLELD